MQIYNKLKPLSGQKKPNEKKYLKKRVNINFQEFEKREFKMFVMLHKTSQHYNIAQNWGKKTSFCLHM